MCRNLIVIALASFALCGTSQAAPEWNKGKGPMMRCLTESALQDMMSKKNETVKACMEANGIVPPTAAPGSPDDGKKTWGEPDMCFMECMMQKKGMVKDGKFMVEEFAKANVKPDLQEQVVKAFQNCLTDGGLKDSYTISKDNKCQDFKPYATCVHKAMNVCFGDDGKNSS